MIKSEIRTRIKNRLNEDGVYRTDAQINQGIEEAAKLMAFLAMPFRKSGTVITSSKIGYFPSDFIFPLRLSISGRRIFPATPRLLSRLDYSWLNTSPGTAAYYFIVSPMAPNCSFWLHPAPNGSVSVTIDYAYLPAAMSDGDEPDIPQAYHGIYEEYGVYYGLMLSTSELLEQAAVSWNRFLGDVAALRKAMIRQYQGMDLNLVPFDVVEEQELALAGQ